MASPDTGPPEGPADTTSTNPVNVPNPLASHAQPADNTPASSTPLELSNLGPHATGDPPESATTSEPLAREGQLSAPLHPDPTAVQQASPEKSQSIQHGLSMPSTQEIDPAPAPPLKREQTAPAIGPSSDKPTPLPKEAETAGVLMITLLLTSGARHPYKIDDKYIKKRNVNIEGNNPINLSIYDLKNLIWREWREEWEARPTNPTSIRLIYAGHMPGDSSKLGDCKFSLGATPHVVHMTVKPQDFIDDEEAGKGGGRDRDDLERSPRCRCCNVM